MQKRVLRASFHGHILADYGPWWRKQFGIEGRNLADVAADRCIEKGLDLYTITNEYDFANFKEVSRFQQIFNEAVGNSPTSEYVVEKLGENAFVMESDSGRIIFLNGKSIRVADDGRRYEISTFGSNDIPDGKSFEETSKRLHDLGLLAVADHPFSKGHSGIVSEEKLLDLWRKGYIDALEHDGKIAVPEFLSLLPVEQFKNYSRGCNRRIEALANRYGIPMIANDDSDGISHIGTAYTEFDADKIRLNSDRDIIQSVNKLILDENFTTHKGYLNFFSFMRYAGWILTVKEHGLGLKEKYEARLRKKE